MEKKIAQIIASALTAFREKYLSPIEKRIEPVETFIKDFTPFDGSELKTQISNIESYDDSDIREQIKGIKEYDDSNLVKQIEDVKKSMPTIPEQYDDSNLVKQIEDVKKSMPTIPEQYDDSALKGLIHAVKEDVNNLDIPKEYNDSALQENINAIQTVFKKELGEVKETYEKEIADLKAKINEPISVELGKAKTYDQQPSDVGQMVLAGNNVYVNLLKGNDTEPSDANKSYKMIMKAPKEPTHMGVWDSNKKDYEFNDIVMWDNASWIKTHDNAQEIPSAGWKLLAKAIRGRKGLKGDTSVVDYQEVLEKQDDEITILKAQVKGLLDATQTN